MEGCRHPMTAIELRARNISKEFNRRSVLRDISFTLSVGDSLAITGKNGSGKSTLVKILAGVLSPTRGTAEYFAESKKLHPAEAKEKLGFVTPYLQLYDEFSAMENLKLLSMIRSNTSAIAGEAETLLKQFQLWDRRDDFVRAYSSGMKQRLKYVFALLHRPQVLILDEPTSNLDSEGIEIVKTIVARQKQSGILVAATSDSDEASWCRQRIHLG